MKAREKIRLMEEARANASLHCIWYMECINTSYKNGNRMNCINCKKSIREENTYRRKMSAGCLRTDASELDEYKIEYKEMV